MTYRALALLVGFATLVASCSSSTSATSSPTGSTPTAARSHATPGAGRPALGRGTESRAIPPGKHCHAPVAADRFGPDRVYEVASCDTGGFAFFVSSDGARSWRRSAIPHGVHDIAAVTVAFASRSTGFLLNVDVDTGRGPLYETRDAGRNWSRSPLPEASGLLTGDGVAYVYDRHEIYSASGDGVVHRLAPGIGPALFALGGVVFDEAGRSADPSEQSTLVVVDGSHVRRVRLPCGYGYFDRDSVLSGLPDGTLIDVCGGEPGGDRQLHRTYASTDDGDSWRVTRSPGGEPVVDQGAMGSAGAFVVGYRGQLLRLRAPGGAWSVVRTIGAGAGLQGCGFSRARYGWVVASAGFPRLYLTDDGGRRWDAVPRP